jgi:hypothetical protein
VPVGDFSGTSAAARTSVGGSPVDGANVHAVVWTAKADVAGAYVLGSTDGGATWGEPVKLGEGSSHPDVACGSGAVSAVWDAFVDGRSSIFASTKRAADKTWSPPRRLSDADATAATHPRIVHTPAGFSVFWTQQRKTGGGGGATWTGHHLDAGPAPAGARLL